VAVYLYGSYAKKNASQKSDLDLAILFEESLKNPGLILSLGVEIQKFLGNKITVDLREIHLGLSPVFLAEVISQGKVIFCQNEAARVSFEIEALRIIDDYQNLKRINLYYLKKSLFQGTYGKTVS